jgi:hypothetical protein
MPTDGGLHLARLRRRQLEDEWALLYDPVDWFQEPQPAVSGFSCCGIPRRCSLGLRSRGLTTWPFSSRRRPFATPSCPPVDCDEST